MSVYALRAVALCSIRLPLYYEAKLLFILWLVFPQTKVPRPSFVFSRLFCWVRMDWYLLPSPSSAASSKRVVLSTWPGGARVFVHPDPLFQLVMWSTQGAGIMYDQIASKLKKKTNHAPNRTKNCGNTAALQLEKLAHLITDCLEKFDDDTAEDHLQAIATAITEVEDLKLCLDNAGKSTQQSEFSHFAPEEATGKVVFPTPAEVAMDIPPPSCVHTYHPNANQHAQHTLAHALTHTNNARAPQMQKDFDKTMRIVRSGLPTVPFHFSVVAAPVLRHPSPAYPFPVRGRPHVQWLADLNPCTCS